MLLLETPFYEHSRPYPGRIADYPPGVRENGGQYSHGASWIVDGFVRLAVNARTREGDRGGGALFARAFEIFEKISPLKKTDPENIAVYGLIPIQQPADIYDGWGHGGRGGWSWYTGSAARMLSAAYAMLGIAGSDGEVGVRDDLFEPKGEIRVESRSDRRPGLEARATPRGRSGAERQIPLNSGANDSAPARLSVCGRPQKSARVRCGRARFLARGATNKPRAKRARHEI